MKATLIFNPKCGTCRKVHEALLAKKVEVTLVEYLKKPPTVAELDAICRKLGIEPQALVRQKEEVFELIEESTRSRQDWLQALHDHPILIQRPIVIIGDKAVIARPPEKLEELFS